LRAGFTLRPLCSVLSGRTGRAGLALQAAKTLRAFRAGGAVRTSEPPRAVRALRPLLAPRPRRAVPAPSAVAHRARIDHPQACEQEPTVSAGLGRRHVDDPVSIRAGRALVSLRPLRAFGSCRTLVSLRASSALGPRSAVRALRAD